MKIDIAGNLKIFKLLTHLVIFGSKLTKKYRSHEFRSSVGAILFSID